MTGITSDQRRQAVTYAVLAGLGLVYAVSFAVFVRTDRSAGGLSRAEGPPWKDRAG
jgi:hypothetical protein